jgi:hypothetical protein
VVDRVQQPVAVVDTARQLVAAAGRVPEPPAVARRALRAGVADRVRQPVAAVDTVLQPAAAGRVPEPPAVARKAQRTGVADRVRQPVVAAGTVPVREEQRQAGMALPVANSARKGLAKAAVSDSPPAACRLLRVAH